MILITSNCTQKPFIAVLTFYMTFEYKLKQADHLEKVLYSSLNARK